MRLPSLAVSESDRVDLEQLVRSNTIEARLAQRARIVLLAAEGHSNVEIGKLVDMHYNQVAVWRQRYAQMGMSGLEDNPRPGRPPTYGHDDVLLMVGTVVTDPPPDNATRWTMEALARRLNDHGVPISASQVWRLCRALDLKPWQPRLVPPPAPTRTTGASRCAGSSSTAATAPRCSLPASMCTRAISPRGSPTLLAAITS